jgi:hypothetical protein
MASTSFPFIRWEESRLESPSTTFSKKEKMISLIVFEISMLISHTLLATLTFGPFTWKTIT